MSTLNFSTTRRRTLLSRITSRPTAKIKSGTLASLGARFVTFSKGMSRALGIIAWAAKSPCVPHVLAAIVSSLGIVLRRWKDWPQHTWHGRSPRNQRAGSEVFSRPPESKERWCTCRLKMAYFGLFLKKRNFPWLWLEYTHSRYFYCIITLYQCTGLNSGILKLLFLLPARTVYKISWFSRFFFF